MNLSSSKNTLKVMNGFVHDFAAGYWLALLVAIAMLHNIHSEQTHVSDFINKIELNFFFQSIAAVVIIMATGAGRTFTYVDNWYGENVEKSRRKSLIVKHVILFAAFGIGYLLTAGHVFH